MKIAQREFLALNSIFGLFKQEFSKFLHFTFYLIGYRKIFSWAEQKGLFPMINSILSWIIRKISQISQKLDKVSVRLYNITFTSEEKCDIIKESGL